MRALFFSMAADRPSLDLIVGMRVECTVVHIDGVITNAFGGAVAFHDAF
jgi:hypothetical protein